MTDSRGFILTGQDLSTDGVFPTAGRSTAIRSHSRRAASGSSPQATCGTARPSASPPPSARGRWSRRSSSAGLPSSVSATELEAVLGHARRRTEALLEPLADEQLTHQYSPLQSPLVWDLAHIGYFEELWLLRNGRPRGGLGRPRRPVRLLRARTRRAGRAADPLAGEARAPTSARCVERSSSGSRSWR